MKVMYTPQSEDPSSVSLIHEGGDVLVTAYGPYSHAAIGAFVLLLEEQRLEAGIRKTLNLIEKGNNNVTD